MSDATWQPSTGQWGIFGTDKDSVAGKKRRGELHSNPAKKIMDEADKMLALLLRQFERASGPDSTYEEQMKLEQKSAVLADEGFLEEADRKAAAVRGEAEQNMKAIETQTAHTGFAGSGTTGRAREALAQTIQEKSGDVYEDLTRARVGQDIALEKMGSASEQEQFSELDRIALEASGIASQARQSLETMEDTKTSYSPNPSLDKFEWRPGDVATAAPTQPGAPDPFKGGGARGVVG